MSSNRFSALNDASGAQAASPGPASSAAPLQGAQQQPQGPTKKKKGHRSGKKKRSRRKSFAVLHEDDHDEIDHTSGDGLYRIPQASLSGTSIDSEALLDHRGHHPMRVRRPSNAGVPSPFMNPFARSSGSHLRSMQATDPVESDIHPAQDERAPLLSESARRPDLPSPGFTSYGARDPRSMLAQSHRPSDLSSRSRLDPSVANRDQYDVNHPPSVPNSPTFGPADPIDVGFADVMITEDGRGHSPDVGEGMSEMDGGPDHLSELRRRATQGAPEDVCFPVPGMSELGDEEASMQGPQERQYKTRRRRGQWPDLSVLEDWQQLEKEDRSDERRVKTITEPQLINGRLRPVRRGWYQTVEDAPYRFTYFNEEFQSTIHSQTISELVQPGGGFQELFIPDPRVLSDDESDDDENEETDSMMVGSRHPGFGTDDDGRGSTRMSSLAEPRRYASGAKDATTSSSSRSESGRATPSGIRPPDEKGQKPPKKNGAEEKEKPIRYGDRPVWWLDVLCPTEAEMKVISKAFGIHPLTAEDIMLQEAREKVELFRHYYFVNYRTFDQDSNSQNFLEPVDMYVVVFREGVLSFHFSMIPHPANVRRRIRQLRDYLILSSDWISYAIIDDITDVFQPLIQNIEDEVDEIDEGILRLHSYSDRRLKDDAARTHKNDDATTVVDPSGDMLRRVGDCRRRVMSLYRLLGNKADVIKGFAKRCNERWEVAPRSEIGLYLGDIQDHIVTMTSNLGHYEKLLARSHGNYLAQINIRMNERQEQTADVLGKLTVLGTIVLPMNIITGLWGMNVWVPGQEYEGSLTWFMCITAGLIMFGVACYMIAKRVYKIV